MVAAVAKLSAPRPSPLVVPRERLYRRLDGASRCGAIWLAAPAGGGKTTLAAEWARARGKALCWYQLDEGDRDGASFLHYLRQAAAERRQPMARLPGRYTPSPRQSLPVLARTFSRQLFACLPSGAALVIDEAERLPPETEGFAVLSSLLAEVPEGITVLVLSRTALPDALVRLHLEDALALVDWDELRLTAAETQQVLARRFPAVPPERARQVHALADGWPAGVRLLAERQAMAREADGALEARSEAMFGYIAAEIFGALPTARQQLLLSLAPLPSFTAAVAASVSGQSSAGAVLEELARNSFFTSRLPGPVVRYRLHPLLRRFLLSLEAQQIDEGRRSAVRCRAVEELIAAEEFEPAVALLIELKDWKRMSAVLDGVGNRLLAEGRHRTVLDWLDAIPADSQNRLSLQLWRARALMPFAADEALARLAALWAALEHSGDNARLVDAWCSLAECHFLARRIDLLSHWWPALRRLLARLASPADDFLRRRVLAHAFVPGSATTFDNAEACCAAALDLAAAESTPVDLRLLLAHRLLWHRIVFRNAPPLPPQLVATARQLCAEGQGSVMPRLQWTWMEALDRVWRDPDDALPSAREAVARITTLLDEHGIDDYSFGHVLNLMMALHGDDMAAADDAAATLQSMPAAPGRGPAETMHRQAHLGSYALACDDRETAFAQAELAVRSADAIGFVWQQVQFRCLFARAAARLGRMQDAFRALRVAQRLVHQHRVGMPRCGPWLAAAAIDLERGRTSAAVAAVRRALAAMAEHAVLRPSTLIVLRAEFESLCSLAWQHGAGRAWVQHVVRLRNLAPPPGTAAEAWPWELRIRTFGALTIERDGTTVAFGRKPPRKVLELLRLLLNAGERPLPVTHVVDTLWPNEEGDGGYHAFLTALHRLRKLLGRQVLVHLEGRVSLDSTRVWIDRAQWERLLEGPPSEQAWRTAIGLYRGAFLGEEDDAWARATRERLRARYRRAVCELAELLFRRGDPAGAREVLEAALCLEPAAEELHRGLARARLPLDRGELAPAAHGESVTNR